MKLFDLNEAPDKVTNESKNPESAAKAKEMSAELERLLCESPPPAEDPGSRRRKQGNPNQNPKPKKKAA